MPNSEIACVRRTDDRPGLRLARTSFAARWKVIRMQKMMVGFFDEGALRDPAMLTSYSHIRSNNPNEIEAAWIAHSRGCRVRIPSACQGSEFVANLARFDEGTVTYCHYGSPIDIDFDAADYARLIYQLSEGSVVCADGEASEFRSSNGGCLIPGGRRWRARHTGNLEDLAIRIPTATLQRKLSA